VEAQHPNDFANKVPDNISNSAEHKFFDDVIRVTSSGGLSGFVMGDFYDGYWVHDQRSGRGCLVTTDGHTFEGLFENDLYQHTLPKIND
jgi:hypothetical protein